MVQQQPMNKQTIVKPNIESFVDTVVQTNVNNENMFKNNRENFEDKVSYFGKENPENVSLLITSCIFFFFSWLSLCYLIFKSSNSSVMYGILFLYGCVGIFFIVSFIYKLVKKCL